MRKKLLIKTNGRTDIIDITKDVNKLIKESSIDSGIINLFVIGSTASLSCIEYEPNLKTDLKEFFQKIAPDNIDYHHHLTWNDDNGHSHIRATLLKPDLTIPIENNKMVLGTWQQIILIDFDTSSREREIIITIIKD